MLLLINLSVQPSSMSNPFVIIMVVIIAMLALAIGLLANVLVGAAELYREKQKKEEAAQHASGAVTTVLLLAGLLLASPLLAQEKTAAAATAASATASSIAGVSPATFYVLAGIVFIEVIILGTLLYNVKRLLAVESNQPAAAAVVAAQKLKAGWWTRINNFKTAEQERGLDLGHDYDGIRELDNNLPPWWLYGFYCTVLFACVYLWQHHVSHTAPLSGEEYAIAMNKAAAEREAYLAKAANNVDENTVKTLTDAASLTAGKTIFETTCFACHGKQGEGGVGPNLTDDYWLHGGSIQDIFKTIKYGWPEKGMKSWKDDYSPQQIAQISSYVKSLHGTHPANGKAPQGTIYTEAGGKEAPRSDSTHADSVKHIAAIY